MTETFYRLHDNPQAPAFSADNAWSGLWGQDFSADGSQSECTDCSEDDGSRAECGTCDGTGWQDCIAGYSCCGTADELLAYFEGHGTADDSAAVVIFEGRRVGTGFDGEPLAIPTGEIRWTTYGALRAEKE